MARKRQLVLINPDPDAEPGDPMRPLGSPRRVHEVLAGFNTSVDGSTRTTGTEMLHGPGFVVEIAGQDEIAQAIIIVQDEEIAWPVLSRLCRQTGWRMSDMETGRTFG